MHILLYQMSQSIVAGVRPYVLSLLMISQCGGFLLDSQCQPREGRAANMCSCCNGSNCCTCQTARESMSARKSMDQCHCAFGTAREKSATVSMINRELCTLPLEGPAAMSDLPWMRVTFGIGTIIPQHIPSSPFHPPQGIPHTAFC